MSARVTLLLAATLLASPAVAEPERGPREWFVEMKAVAKRVRIAATTASVRSAVAALGTERMIAKSLETETRRWPLDLQASPVFTECNLAASLLAGAAGAAEDGSPDRWRDTWRGYSGQEDLCLGAINRHSRAG